MGRQGRNSEASSTTMVSKEGNEMSAPTITRKPKSSVQTWVLPHSCATPEGGSRSRTVAPAAWDEVGDDTAFDVTKFASPNRFEVLSGLNEDEDDSGDVSVPEACVEVQPAAVGDENVSNPSKGKKSVDSGDVSVPEACVEVQPAAVGDENVSNPSKGKKSGIGGGHRPTLTWARALRKFFGSWLIGFILEQMGLN